MLSQSIVEEDMGRLLSKSCVQSLSREIAGEWSGGVLTAISLLLISTWALGQREWMIGLYTESQVKLWRDWEENLVNKCIVLIYENIF